MEIFQKLAYLRENVSIGHYQWHSVAQCQHVGRQTDDRWICQRNDDIRPRHKLTRIDRAEEIRHVVAESAEEGSLREGRSSGSDDFDSTIMFAAVNANSRYNRNPVAINFNQRFAQLT